MKNQPKSLPASVPVAPELTLQNREGTPFHGNYSHSPAAPVGPIQRPGRRAEGGKVFDLRNEQTTP